jgi:serine/threonine-protein kinase
MPFGTRVWSIGKLLLLIGALGATFLAFFGLSVRVALKVQEVEVPALQGRSLEEARAILANLDMALRSDDPPRFDDQVAAGRILQQDPPAGASARRQRGVRVWLSAGPHTATVPRLVEESERTATIRLENEGLELAVMSQFHSSDYAPDAVVAQNPLPDTRAPRVSLLVNRPAEPASYVMPDLIGTDGERAAAVLREHALHVTLTRVPDQSGVPAGTVIRQQPAGGLRVSATDAIALEVAP